MSDTPMTDSAIFRAEDSDGYGYDVVCVGFTRRLERELAEARKQINGMRSVAGLDCSDCVMEGISNTETCIECMRNPLYERSKDNYQVKESK